MFHDHGVLIEKYDGYTRYDEVALDKPTVWIQIVDLPPLLRKDHVVRSLAKKVGTMEKVMLNPRWGDGRIVRIRLKLDIHEPLMRYAAITKDKRRCIIQCYTRRCRCSALCVAIWVIHTFCMVMGSMTRRLWSGENSY